MPYMLSINTDRRPAPCTMHHACTRARICTENRAPRVCTNAFSSKSPHARQCNLACCADRPRRALSIYVRAHSAEWEGWNRGAGYEHEMGVATWFAPEPRIWGPSWPAPRTLSDVRWRCPGRWRRPTLGRKLPMRMASLHFRDPLGAARRRCSIPPATRDVLQPRPERELVACEREPYAAGLVSIWGWCARHGVVSPRRGHGRGWELERGALEERGRRIVSPHALSPRPRGPVRFVKCFPAGTAPIPPTLFCQSVFENRPSLTVR